MQKFPATPLVDAVMGARGKGLQPMQIPGHKYRYTGPSTDAPGFELLHTLIRDDVALQGGADDNAFTGGYLEQAEELWSQEVGADHSRFLVGGGSQGNLAALLTVGRDNNSLAIDRTSHRSALAGLVLSGATPVWVNPEIHPEFGLPIGLTADSLEHAAGVAALFVTSPAYIGSMSEIAPLAQWAHSRDIALVVDQAWGAHLDFNLPGYPSALSQGADISVTSIHKALLGYSQTAVVACKGNLINANRLNRAVDQSATTSPSATLLASIDATRAIMQAVGESALANAIEIAESSRKRLREVQKLVVLDDSTANCKVDPLKIVLWLPRTGATGIQIAAALWQAGIGVESADNDTLVMTVTISDTEEILARTTSLLIDLIEKFRGPERTGMPSAVWTIKPDVVLTPRAAMQADRRRINLNDAVGEICAEQFCPYPPGVPLVGPGERITQEIVEAIAAAGKIGRVAYCSDSSLQTVEVVC